MQKDESMELVKLSKLSDANQSDIIKIDNSLLENWLSNLQSNKMGQNELKNTERTLIHSIYEQLWLNTSDSSKVSTQSTKKLTQRQKASQSSKEITEVPSQGFVEPNHEIIERKPNEEADKSQFYFISADFIRKLISGEFNQSPADLSSNSFTQKYLCSHKLLNPLAINRLKLVSKKGLDLMCSVYSVSLGDLGALEAFSNKTTRCWQCVFNCFDYLKCKDRIKQDGKLFKQLMKYEFELNNENINLEKSIEASELIKHYEQKGNEYNSNGESSESDDVILIEKQDNLNTNGSSGKMSVGDEKQDYGLRKTSENDKENRNSKVDKPSCWYWVGKESLKSWQSLALKNYETRLPSLKFSDQITNDLRPDIIEETFDTQNEIQEIQGVQATSNGNSLSNDLNSAPSSSLNYFNEDVVCMHSNLSPTANKRLVCAELWNLILNRYFNYDFDDDEDEDNAQESLNKKHFKFTNESQECKICLVCNSVFFFM